MNSRGLSNSKSTGSEKKKISAKFAMMALNKTLSLFFKLLGY